VHSFPFLAKPLCRIFLLTSAEDCEQRKISLYFYKGIEKIHRTRTIATKIYAEIQIIIGKGFKIFSS